MDKSSGSQNTRYLVANGRSILHGLDEYAELAEVLSSRSYASACKDSGTPSLRVSVPWKVIKDLEDDNRIMEDFEGYRDIMRSLGVDLVKNADYPAFASGWTQKKTSLNTCYIQS